MAILKTRFHVISTAASLTAESCLRRKGWDILWAEKNQLMATHPNTWGGDAQQALINNLPSRAEFDHLLSAQSQPWID